jgi:Fe2+ or Zn2+ uptake regulation protein
MTQRAAARLPENYRILLATVEAAAGGTHRSTAQLYDLMRQAKPGIGYSTVQRGLQRLADEGLIMPVRLPDVEALLYEPAGPPHAHFACRGCGRTFDVDFVVPRAVLAKISRDLGAVISSEAVAFRGFCKSCAA